MNFNEIFCSDLEAWRKCFQKGLRYVTFWRFWEEAWQKSFCNAESGSLKGLKIYRRMALKILVPWDPEDLWMLEGIGSQHKKKIKNCLVWQKSFGKKVLGLEYVDCLKCFTLRMGGSGRKQHIKKDLLGKKSYVS